jgi:hypothetical protein
MADQIRNEHIKLFANWCNTIAVGIITVGVFTPLAVQLYGIGEQLKRADLLNYLAWICVLAAVALHSIAQWALEALDVGDDAS